MTTITKAPHTNPDLRHLALLAAGRTGADIERIVRELRANARRQKRPFDWSDLEAALRANGRRQLTPELARRIAIHEAGHALAYTVLDTAVVETVSIGTERGGETVVRLDATRIQTENDLVRLMACLLAGRVAEKLIVGDMMIGSGGSEESDLARATRLALDAETGLGLSPEQPLLYRPPSNPGDMLLYNPLLAARVNARLEAAEEMAIKLLEEHRTALVEVADRLVDKQVIEGDEVRTVLGRAAMPLVKSGPESAIPKTHDALRNSNSSIPPSATSILN